MHQDKTESTATDLQSTASASETQSNEQEAQRPMIEILPQANKGILIEAIAEKLGVPRKNATIVLDSVLDSVRDLLQTRGRVAVKGFGTFERKIRKGRSYKHPVTGKSISVADRETVRFNASEALNAETQSAADQDS